jgi:hypothetical protein
MRHGDEGRECRRFHIGTFSAVCFGVGGLILVVTSIWRLFLLLS